MEGSYTRLKPGPEQNVVGLEASLTPGHPVSTSSRSSTLVADYGDSAPIACHSDQPSAPPGVQLTTVWRSTSLNFVN